MNGLSHPVVMVERDAWPALSGWCHVAGFSVTQASDGSPRYRVSSPSEAPHHAHRTTRAVVTLRESQVLTGVARGMSIEDVAAVLGLSENTVRHHLKKIYRRLGARSRAHAVALAYELGVIAPGTAALAPLAGVA